MQRAAALRAADVRPPIRLQLRTWTARRSACQQSIDALDVAGRIFELPALGEQRLVEQDVGKRIELLTRLQLLDQGMRGVDLKHR